MCAEIADTLLTVGASWTKGARVVCLPREVNETQRTPDMTTTHLLKGACTTVRSNSTFSIRAEFGGAGPFDYGLTNDPGRSTEAECGCDGPELSNGVVEGTAQYPLLRTDLLPLDERDKAARS